MVRLLSPSKSQKNHLIPKHFGMKHRLFKLPDVPKGPEKSRPSGHVSDSNRQGWHPGLLARGRGVSPPTPLSLLPLHTPLHLFQLPWTAIIRQRKQAFHWLGIRNSRISFSALPFFWTLTAPTVREGYEIAPYNSWWHKKSGLATHHRYLQGVFMEFGKSC